MRLRSVVSFVMLFALASEAQARRQEPTTPPAEETPPAAPSIGDLRKEYEKIREAVFSSRARAAAVGDALYSTRLDIRLRYDTPRSWQVRRATVRLDGANVYEDEQGAVAADEAPRFSGFVAPGRHLITIRIEAASKDDAKFTYTTEDTFFVEAPRDRVVTVSAEAREDGDMAWSFSRKNRGTYRLRLDVDVVAKEVKREGGK
jgi:dipeptidyl aminopeptidase/acylaminoacyl peptidase